MAHLRVSSIEKETVEKKIARVKSLPSAVSRRSIITKYIFTRGKKKICRKVFERERFACAEREDFFLRIAITHVPVIRFR